MPVVVALMLIFIMLQMRSFAGMFGGGGHRALGLIGALSRC